MANFTTGLEGFGLYVPGGVSHYHIEDGRVLTFKTEALAEIARPEVQRHYHNIIEIHRIDPRDKIAPSGVVLGRE